MGMSLGFLLGAANPLVMHDKFSPFDPTFGGGNGCVVTFFCPGKRKIIKAVLSEGFSISAKSNWKELFGGGIGGSLGKLLDLGDNANQFIKGQSIRQPWFGRKYWTGTTPLSFTLSFQFVSFSNAKTQVYDPMINLMSLLYPRSTKDDGSLTKYFIPGPGILFDATQDIQSSHEDYVEGDRVAIALGSFLRFKGCYITSLTADVANSFSPDGFPHQISVKISFDTMDVSFVKKNGEFMSTGFEDASVKVAAELKNLQGLAQQALAGAGKLIDKGTAAAGEGLKTLVNFATKIP